jgi:lectin, mannose-binding 2
MPTSTHLISSLSVWFKNRNLIAILSIVTINTYSAILGRRDAKKKKTSIFGSSNKARVTDSEAPETWLAFFIKLFFLVGVCAGGYFGYQEYQRRKLYGISTWTGPAAGGFGGGQYSNHKRF